MPELPIYRFQIQYDGKTHVVNATDEAAARAAVSAKLVENGKTPPSLKGAVVTVSPEPVVVVEPEPKPVAVVEKQKAV